MASMHYFREVSDSESEESDPSLNEYGPRPIAPFVGEVSYEVHETPTSHTPRIDMPVAYCEAPKFYTIPGQLDMSPIARFYPPRPNDRPTTLFAPEETSSHSPRYVRRSNWREMLIYTDGACLNNGRNNPQAGWAFVFHPSQPKVNPSDRLELRGIDDRPYPQTSNRAELRAVLAALEFRVWKGEAFLRIVIATDSEYVVLGLTKYLGKWRRSGWKTADGQFVKNRDLWEAIAARCEHFGKYGTQTLFWLIPREWNTAADALAKDAAAKTVVQETYTKVHGIMI